jgi:hypothetical protein
MKLNIFCNVSQRRPEATSAGATLTWPEFTAGDRIKIGIRFLEVIEGIRSERTLALNSGRLTLGVIDAQPTGGSFSLKVGAGASTPANTTPLLPHSVSTGALAASINALTSVNSPCSVTIQDGTYLLRFATTPGLSVIQNTLTPASFARICTREENNEHFYELRLMQAPLAQAPLFTREVPPAPTIETVQDGGSDEARTYLVPEIQRLTVPPLFRGSFVLRYGEFAKSPILDPEADEDTIAEALKALFTPQGFTPTVRSEDDGRFLVVFDDANSLGENLNPLAVEVFTAPEGDVTFDLNLNTREVFDALRASPLRKDCYLEFEAEVCDDGKNPAAPDTIARTVTLFQSTVTLRRELAWNGLSTSTSPDWLRPPTNQSYIPFSLDQILTGQQQAFAAALGDGHATEFTLDHNLASDLCQVVVRENSTPGRLLRPDEYSVTIDSANALTITLPDAPANNALAVFVVGIGPASAFQAHTHAIGQITGLQAILDILGTRLENVEAIVTVPGAGGTEKATIAGTIGLVPMAEAIPATVVRGSGTSPTYLMPPLPRAIRAASVGTILGDELADPTTHAGAVMAWGATSEVYLTGTRLRRGRVICTADAPAVLCDGYNWWLAADKNGAATGTTFHPVEMQRTMWEIALTPELLAPGRTLTVNFSILLALVASRPELRGVYTLRVRKGTMTSEAGMTGANVEGITWDQNAGEEQLLLEQRISLARAAVVHPFSIQIARAQDGTLSAGKTIYGKSSSAPPPQHTQFIVRAELAAFDLENYSNTMGLPLGQVFVICGKSDGDAAKAILKRFSFGADDTQAAPVLTATIT